MIPHSPTVCLSVDMSGRPDDVRGKVHSFWFLSSLRKVVSCVWCICIENLSCDRSLRKNLKSFVDCLIVDQKKLLACHCRFCFVAGSQDFGLDFAGLLDYWCVELCQKLPDFCWTYVSSGLVFQSVLISYSLKLSLIAMVKVMVMGKSQIESQSQI